MNKFNLVVLLAALASACSSPTQTLTAPSAPSDTSQSVPPLTRLNLSVSRAVAGEPTTITLSASGGPVDAVLDFGDGASLGLRLTDQSTQALAHVYREKGAYTVMLTFSAADGTVLRPSALIVVQ